MAPNFEHDCSYDGSTTAVEKNHWIYDDTTYLILCCGEVIFQLVKPSFTALEIISFKPKQDINYLILCTNNFTLKN